MFVFLKFHAFKNMSDEEQEPERKLFTKENKKNVRFDQFIRL